MPDSGADVNGLLFTLWLCGCWADPMRCEPTFARAEFVYPAVRTEDEDATAACETHNGCWL
jgi:hypothetical protein